MRQTAPNPTVLEDLVAQLSYKPGWRFTLQDIDRGQGSEGLTLTIQTLTQDSDTPDIVDFNCAVRHLFIVPAAAYNEASWRRWLLDQIILVETHEACEFFRVRGQRAFAPNHGPGFDPYGIRELNTLEDAETTFRGGHEAQPPPPPRVAEPRIEAKG